MSTYISPLHKIMSDAATKAARTVIRDFNELEKLQVSRKGTADFVTAADLKSEQVLRQELARARPGFAFLAEESGASGNSESDHCWVIDPIDGTTNFMHGLPHFSITFGLLHNNEVIAGIVFDPLKNEEFFAEKGRGAFLNGFRIKVSGRTDPTQALIGMGLPFGGCTPQSFEQSMRELARVMPQVAGVRRLGTASLDLAYVACGRFEGYWERGLKPWDMVAGQLLVREAGGVVTDMTGTGHDYVNEGILTGNKAMHAHLLKLFTA